MSMDDVTRSALIRGVAAFAVVLTVGSVVVYAAGRLDRSEAAVSPSATAVVTSAPSNPGTQTPEAWLAWVPGGLPDGFASQMTAIPVIDDTTTNPWRVTLRVQPEKMVAVNMPNGIDATINP